MASASADRPPFPSEGTVACSCTLPAPWPPTTTVPLHTREFEGAHIEITAEPTGQITASIVREGQTRSIASCRLNVVRLPLETTVALTWSETELRIYVAGQLAASVPAAPQDPTVLAVLPRLSSHPDLSFSDENQRALERRLSAMKGTHPKHGRSRASDNYLFSGLRNEYLQMMDLISAVRNGGHHHIAGLASRIRTVLADTKQPAGGLLQWCAATKNAPLLLYTDPATKRLIMVNPGNSPTEIPEAGIGRALQVGIVPTGSATSTETFTALVDLDVWLNMRTARIRNRVYTNRQLIHTIGSTIGSHFDIDQHPLIRELQSGKIGAKEAIDMLGGYVANVAGIAAALCQRLLPSEDEV